MDGSLTGIQGRSGKFLKKNIPSQMYEDNIGRVRFMPGEFIPDEIIRRFNIDPTYFVHPDSCIRT